MHFSLIWTSVYSTLAVLHAFRSAAFTLFWCFGLLSNLLFSKFCFKNLKTLVNITITNKAHKIKLNLISNLQMQLPTIKVVDPEFFFMLLQLRKLFQLCNLDLLLFQFPSAKSLFRVVNVVYSQYDYTQYLIQFWKCYSPLNAEVFSVWLVLSFQLMLFAYLIVVYSDL